MMRTLRDTNDVNALEAAIVAVESFDSPSPEHLHELEVARFRLEELRQALVIDAMCCVSIKYD